ncbi:hypothetical protein GCM10009696_35300 [Kocuria himachalensis]
MESAGITTQDTVTQDRGVLWAAVAHAGGFDGIVWMSRHHKTSRAYVFSADPTGTGDFAVHPDPDRVRAFAFAKDLDRFTRLLAPLNVAITGPSARACTTRQAHAHAHAHAHAPPLHLRSNQWAGTAAEESAGGSRVGENRFSGDTPVRGAADHDPAESTRSASGDDPPRWDPDGAGSSPTRSLGGRMR